MADHAVERFPSIRGSEQKHSPVSAPPGHTARDLWASDPDALAADRDAYAPNQ